MSSPLLSVNAVIDEEPDPKLCGNGEVGEPVPYPVYLGCPGGASLGQGRFAPASPMASSVLLLLRAVAPDSIK